MADEKLVVNIGQNDGTTVKFNFEGESRSPFYGLNIGKEFSGDLLDPKFEDYTFKITGGSDQDGVPMRSDIEGIGRIRPLISGGVGYNPTRKGIRKRKLIRGTEIFDDISQINIKVIKKGKTPLSE